MSRLFQKKHLQELRRLESVEMVAENQQHRGKEKSLVDNMPLAVCWNAGSVVRAYHDEAGIVAQNIRKRYGNV